VPSLRIPSLNLPLCIVVLTWGFNFVALKVLYEEMTAPAVSVVRYAVMLALLLIVCRVRREPLRVERADFPRVMFAGFISMGVYMVLFLEGMAGTTAAEGAIVLATAPLLTYLLSVLLKHEAYRPLALLGTFIAFVGVAIVVLGGAAAGHGSVRGNLLVLLSALVWAYSAVIMKPLVTKYKPLPLFTLSVPAGLPVLLPYGLAASWTTDYAAISPSGWLMFAHVSVLSGVVAFVCFYEGVRQVGAAAATMYQFFVPPTAAFCAWLVLGKALALPQLFGLLVVIAGVVTTARARAATLARPVQEALA